MQRISARPPQSISDKQVPQNRPARPSAAFRSNDPTTATELLQQQGRVYQYAHPDHRIAAVALDYTAQSDRVVIVASDPAERQGTYPAHSLRSTRAGQTRSGKPHYSVLVEQEYSNANLAANYSPGDQIHYRKGSPSIEGIPHNSIATVLDIDAKKNLLTIETRDGEQVSYNPGQLKQQTKESTVYREEERDLAVGERIQFTAPDRENRIRSGDFATVERIGDDNALSVRLDNGKTVELDPEKARHIDYGYTVETAKHVSADRILITGESSQLAEQQATLAKLNPNVRELAIYTSDSTNLCRETTALVKSRSFHKKGFPMIPSLSNASEPSGPSIEVEGYGIGL